jgi:hypothetical protein
VSGSVSVCVCARARACVRVRAYVRACVREREREREKFPLSHFYSLSVHVIQSGFALTAMTDFPLYVRVPFHLLSVTHTGYVRRWPRYVVSEHL